MFTTIDPKTIERMPEYGEDVEKEMRGQVLAEAYENFGYSAESFNAAGPLAKALAKLQIRPLNTQKVIEYQESKQKDKETHPRVVFNIGLFLGTMLLDFTINFFGKFAADTQDTIYVITVFVAVISLVIINLGVEPDFLDSKRVRFYWEQHGLSKRSSHPYGRYIPIHVLNLANQIVKECPTVNLTIEELTKTVERVPRPQPDPFLVASIGSEKYYIEVWDERDYERKR